MWETAIESKGIAKRGRVPAPLVTVVRQATEALVLMDANRLEELALCCADLTRGDCWSPEDAGLDGELSRLREPLRLLECVLFETRANLSILSRLHAMGRLPQMDFAKRATSLIDAEMAQEEVHRGDG